MPAQPARDRFRRGIDKEHTLPRDEHVLEPHLAIELVIAAAEGRNERVAVARRDLAAQRGNAGRIHRHDEACAMLADVDAAEGANIDVLGKGRTRMHADLAADDNAGIALATSFNATRSRGSGRIR